MPLDGDDAAMVRPRKRPSESTERSAEGLDVNAVVSFNVKAIRERRRMTQQAVADRLAELTGHRLPQASISAMERGFDGDRRRRFDAHELYLLSQVFDVPIAYFFLPPPDLGGLELADSGRPVVELYRSLLGTRSQLEVVDDRLRAMGVQDPDMASEILTVLFGAEGAVGNWHEHFRTWRAERIAAIEKEFGSDLDEVAEFLADFAAKVKSLGPSGYLRSVSGTEDERNSLDDEE
jgi:transcriptional regulator with XRE-family HTH domain